MINSAELRRLRRAIYRLPPAERSVFDAVRYEGLEYAEVAARMGLSAAEVERLLVRALAQIVRDVEDAERRRWWRLW